MQRADRRAQALGAVGAEIARLGREKADGVVAPVVAQAHPQQPRIVHQHLHRHELDRGDAQAAQMVEDRRAAQRLIRPAQRLWHAGVAHRQAAGVRLIEHRARPGRARALFRRNRRRRCGQHAFRHRRRAVGGRGKAVAAHGVMAEQQRRQRVEGARVRPRVGVEQQLGGVEAVAALGRPDAIGAQAIKRARLQPLHMAMPDRAGALRQRQPGQLLRAVGREQTHLHAARRLREHREIGAARVQRRAQRIRAPGGDGEAPHRATRWL